MQNVSEENIINIVCYLEVMDLNFLPRMTSHFLVIFFTKKYLLVGASSMLRVNG